MVRKRLLEYIGSLDDCTMQNVNQALAISLGLVDIRKRWKGEESSRKRKRMGVYPYRYVPVEGRLSRACFYVSNAAF